MKDSAVLYILRVQEILFVLLSVSMVVTAFFVLLRPVASAKEQFINGCEASLLDKPVPDVRAVEKRCAELWGREQEQ